MKNPTPTQSPSRRPQHSSDEEEKNLSNRLLQLTEGKDRQASRGSHQNYTDDLRGSASHRTSGRGSMENTVLVQSNVTPVPQRQLRPQSQPFNIQYPQFSPNYPQTNPLQNQIHLPNHQQFQPSQAIHPHNHFVVPGQFAPNWINQPQTTQARLEDARRTPSFAQPQQMMQSQRVVEPTQMQLRRGMAPKQGYQHPPPQASPHKIMFNYNQNTSQPSKLLTQSAISNQITQPRQLPSSQNGTEPLVWEQKYSIIVDLLDIYYAKLDVIIRDYALLQSNITKTESFQQLHSLKEKSKELLNTIIQTEKELKESIDQNKQAQSTNWKAKYEQLLSTQNTKNKQREEEWTIKYQELQQRLREAEKQNQLQAQSNSALTDHYLIEQAEKEQLKQRIRDYEDKQHEQNNNGNKHELQKAINAKDEQINELKITIEQLSKSISASVNARMSANNNLKVSVDLDQYNEDKEQMISNLQNENTSLSTVINKNKQEYQEELNKAKHKIAIYEAELTKRMTEVTNCHLEIQNKQNTIQQLSKLERHNHNGQTQAQMRRLKHEIKMKEETHEADAKIFATRVQELIDKLKMVSMQRDNVTIATQEKINLLESDITRKDGTVRNLRDRILQLQEEKRMKEMEMKYSDKKSGNSLDFSSELNSLKRQLSEKNNDIEQLEGQMAEYKRITNQYQDRLNVKTHEINNIKRQLDANSNAQEQILKLTELLNRRNVQIIELKSLSFELEKMKSENDMLRQEVITLKDSLRRKQEELCDFSDKVYVLEHHIREVESAKEKQTAAKLQEERQLLETAVQKKDQEIAKLRQANQLLQSNVEESEAQLEKLKSKLTSGQRLSESVNLELRNKLKLIEKQVAEYEHKIENLEEVNAILQDQVTTLTTQIHLKFQNAQNFQLQLRQEQQRARALQNEFKQLLDQAEQLRSKVKEMQKKNQIMNKELQGEIEKKKELINTKKNEMVNLNNRLLEVEKTSKAKDSQIKQLEKTIETLNYKIRNFDNNIEEMEYLKHKITEYEVKINMFSIQRPYSRATDLEPTQVFERKVIYKLKMQNDALKKELGLGLHIKNPQISLQHIPQRDTNSQHVKERLNNFNQKLEDIIGQHFSEELPDISDQLYKQFERDKAQLIQKHSAEIRELKKVIQQLEHNQLQLQAAIPWQQTFSMVGNQKRSVKMLDNIYNEQIQFYRQKNQELQERVDDHIRVNKELKDNIAQLIRSHGDTHSLQYYKRQIEKCNETIAILQVKVKKTNEQSRKSREESVRSNSRVITDNYSFEAEAKANELSRKINQLTLQLNQAQKDKANEAQMQNDHQREKKKLKNQIQELKKSRQQTLRIGREKQSALQQQITRLDLKLKGNQLQIESLRDVLDKKQYHHSQQLQDNNTRLIELQQQNNQHRTNIQQLNISLQKSQRDIIKWENQNKNLLSQVQRFKEMADVSTKKSKQAQSQLQNVRMQVSEMQGRLRLNNSNTEAFSFREQQYREQTVKANNQIRLLQAEIERLNQFSQRKLSEKDTTIVKNKDTIDEHRQKIHQLEQRLDQMRIESYRSSESTQTVFGLRDEITQLKLMLETKNSESNDRLRQIEELRRSLDQAESQLRWVQNTTSRNLNQMSEACDELQAEQRRLKKNNYELNVQIQAHQHQLSEKDHMNSELNQIITQLQDQINQVENQLQEIRTTKDKAESKVLQLKSDYCLLENQLRQAKYNSSRMTEVSSSVTISELNCTIVELKLEIRTLKQNADNRIYKLESNIQLLQDQLREARQTSNTTNQANQLRSTIAVLEHRLQQLNRNEGVKSSQINDFNIRIIMLESQLREVSNSKDAQLQLLEQLLNHSRYVIEFMRSNLIEVEVLLSEDTIPLQFLSLKVNEEIRKGLEQCQRWNQAQ